MKQWLTSLGMLTAGQMSAEDAKMKMAAYLPLINMPPAAILTKRTLADAGREFKWFPSFAELEAFLSNRAWPLHVLAARLKRLSESTPALQFVSGSGYSKFTEEQKAAHEVLMGRARAALTGGG
jgi:hypothetical protein